MDMERRFRQLQRATVARSALDVIALVFLGAGFAFWGVAFWQLLAPPQLASLLSIQVAVLALVYSLAAPLLLSMLVPTTPAGQLLQKTQWATIGFWVVFGCAGFLAFECYTLIAAWLSAQGGIDPVTHLPVLEATGQVRPLAFSLTIAFVVIPALAWVQLTPERWLQQIQQAHQVKKLEMQQRGELAIIKAKILRAERLAVIPWVNLLPLEKEEIMSTVRGLLMGQSDLQRDIVRTMGLSSDLERDILGDDEIAKQLDYVAQQIDVLPSLAPASPRDTPAADQALMRAPRQDAVPVAPQPRSAMAGTPAPQRPAAPRSAPQRYAAEFAAAREGLADSGIWSVRTLSGVLGTSERSARERLNAWLEDGRARAADTKGLFYFTESGVA